MGSAEPVNRMYFVVLKLLLMECAILRPRSRGEEKAPDLVLFRNLATRAQKGE